MALVLKGGVGFKLVLGSNFLFLISTVGFPVLPVILVVMLCYAYLFLHSDLN